MQNTEKQTFITKKLGSTCYIVNIRFSDTSTETFNDKLLRLITADNNKEPEATACKKEAITC